MEVEDVLNYVMNTPGNTNPNVLKPMLNKLKGGGVLVVTDTGNKLNKTWQEIHDAMLSGGAVISKNDGDIVMAITEIGISFGTYNVFFSGLKYSTSTASDYPAMTIK